MGNLYTGITQDVQRRFKEHQEGGAKAAKYLKGKIRTTKELVEIDWIPLKKALKLPMADVTEFMIEELISFNGDISKINKMLDNRPMFTWKMGKQWITRK